MNEQIEKLFDQALEEFGAENEYATIVVPNSLQRDFVEKFAELIIKECASLFPLQFTDEQYPRRIDKTIRKHFEVDT